MHLAIDDHSRVSFARIKPDETAASCVEFLREAVAYYASLGVRIDRVMTDNGTGYKNTFRAACIELGIRHLRTKPYTPKTNGKAERFVQTSLREWAYARPMSVRPNAKRPCCRSSTATTGIDLTQISTTSHLCHVSQP